MHFGGSGPEKLKAFKMFFSAPKTHFRDSGPESLQTFKLRFSGPSKRILKGSGNQNLQNAFCGAPKTQFRGPGPQSLQTFKMCFSEPSTCISGCSGLKTCKSSKRVFDSSLNAFWGFGGLKPASL